MNILYHRKSYLSGLPVDGEHWRGAFERHLSVWSEMVSRDIEMESKDGCESTVEFLSKLVTLQVTLSSLQTLFHNTSTGLQIYQKLT